MQNLKDHFYSSLESFDDGAEVCFDHTDTIANGLATDMDDIDNKADRIDNDIEGAETDIASLDSLVTALDESRDVGLESWSARFTQTTLQSIQNRYQITGSDTDMPAMECFQDKQARLATTVTMESVKETIQKIWAWIKEQWSKFVDLMKEYYRRLTKSLDYIADESRKVKKVAQRSKFAGGVDIDLGSAGKKITKDLKIDTDFRSSLTNVSQLTVMGEETYAKIAADVKQVMAVKYGEGDKDDTRDFFTQEVPIPKGFILAQKPDRWAVGADALKVYVSSQLPGDVVVVIGVFGDNNAPSAYNFSRGHMVHGRCSITPAKSGTKNTRTKTLSSEEVFSLCQFLDKTVARLKSNRSVIERNISEIKKTIDDIQRSHQSLDGGKAVVAEIVGKVTRWHYKNSAIYGGTLVRTCENIAFDVISGYLTFAKRSVEAGLSQKAA